MKFSLKTLLILVTICAVVVGVWSFAYHQFNKAIEKEVASMMGGMLFDSDPNEVLPEDSSQTTLHEPQVVFGDPILETELRAVR